MDLQTDFTSKDCLFGAVKLNKNADPDKSLYSGWRIGFDSRVPFLISNFNWDKLLLILVWAIVH